MAGKFTYKSFADINLDDIFFDSLKADYPGTENSTEFCAWFHKKAKSGSKAYVYEDESGIGAFVYLKEEDEEITLKNAQGLPKCKRLKLGTLKISNLHQGQRIGEGAIGFALWEWQRSKINEIYVTIFPKHETLIKLLEKFGFILVGTNLNGEQVYIKSRLSISYENPYASFPFVNPEFREAGYLIFEAPYHDTMFPYSELKNTDQKRVELNVANGVSKIYVSAKNPIKNNIGEPVLIYRKHNGETGKRYRSCVTSFGMITDIIEVKKNGRKLLSFEDLLERIGNKSVFDKKELRNQYDTKYNVIIIELLYYAYFGAGHNVNCAWLDAHNLWSKNDGYPTDTKLSVDEFKRILEKGNLDVQNIIID